MTNIISQKKKKNSTMGLLRANNRASERGEKRN